MGEAADRRMLDHLFGRFGPVVVDADARHLGLPERLLCRATDSGVIPWLSKSGFVAGDRSAASKELVFEQSIGEPVRSA